MTARELLSLYQQESDRWVEDAKAYFPMKVASDCHNLCFGILILLSSLVDMDMADSREISFLATHWHFCYVEQLESLGEQVQKGAPLVFPSTLLGYILEKKYRAQAETEFCTNLLKCAFTLKKLQLTRPDKEEEELEKAIARLTQPWDVTSLRRKLCTSLNMLLRQHPLEFNPRKAFLRHGPGAINSKVSYPKGNRNNPFQKWEEVYFDPCIEYMCHKCGLLSPYGYLFWVGQAAGRDLDPSQLQVRHTRSSKLVTVPKTRKKPRVIATEQPERQLMQQGLQNAMRYALRTNPWWASRTSFEDPQGIARKCLSQSGYATIDLSAASDGVRTEMIKLIFKGTDWLLPLLATRTTFVEWRHQLYRLTTFGTMGTATTFPTEDVVFVLIAQMATNIRRLCGDKDLLKPHVFGDDILIDVRAYYTAIAILEMLGFEVNSEKSYNNFHNFDPDRIVPLFREACGVHRYLQIFDVKPLYVKRAPHLSADGKVSYDDASLIVNLYNQYRGSNLEYNEYPLTTSILWDLYSKVGLPWSRYKIGDVGFTPTPVGFFGNASCVAKWAPECKHQVKGKSVFAFRKVCLPSLTRPFPAGYIDGYPVAVHSSSTKSEIQFSSKLGLSSDDFDYVAWLYRAWYTERNASSQQLPQHIVDRLLERDLQSFVVEQDALHASFMEDGLTFHACERVICRKHGLKKTVISQICHC